jgi:hypothetical protein
VLHLGRFVDRAARCPWRIPRSTTHGPGTSPATCEDPWKLVVRLGVGLGLAVAVLVVIVTVVVAVVREGRPDEER